MSSPMIVLPYVGIYNTLLIEIVKIDCFFNKRIMFKQPDTKVKMTNVATIRYKINNKSF